MNVDKLFKSINKKQRYLVARLVVYTVLLYLSFRPMIYEEDLSHQYLLNTVIFLFLPLLIEYIWGMQTYCKGANNVRFIGIIYTFVIVFTSFIGLMGGYSISDVEGNIIFESNKTVFVLNVLVLKYTVYITPCLLLFDLIFAFSLSEIKLYKIEEKILDELDGLEVKDLEMIEVNEKSRLTKIIQGSGGE